VLWDVAVGHPDFGRLIPCSCRRVALAEMRQHKLLKASNIGPLTRMTFDSFRPDGLGLRGDQQRSLHIAYDAAKHFASQPEGWLILTGSYGCGKTHLAAAITNECLARGVPALFVVVPDLLDYLRASFAPTSQIGYSQRFEDVRNAAILVLDDFGTQNATPWAQEKLYQILNHRYNAQLPTVITTNNDWEEIDVRIRSRMADQQISTIMKIQAPDYRRIGVDDEEDTLSILPLLARMTFDTFSLRSSELTVEEEEDLRAVVKLAKEFAARPRGWLVLTGDYGCGKTHLAAAISHHRVNLGERPLFIVVPDLLDHLRASFDPQSQVRYDKRFDMVRNAPLLVLDDLGTQSATPWAREKIYQIFNHRYNAQLATVITMNRIEGTDPRLITRMLEMQGLGLGSIRQIKAPTYQGPGAKKQKTTRGGRGKGRRRSTQA